MRFIIVLSSSVFLEASRDTLGNHAGVPPPIINVKLSSEKENKLMATSHGWTHRNYRNIKNTMQEGGESKKGWYCICLFHFFEL